MSRFGVKPIDTDGIRFREPLLSENLCTRPKKMHIYFSSFSIVTPLGPLVRGHGRPLFLLARLCPISEIGVVTCRFRVDWTRIPIGVCFVSRYNMKSSVIFKYILITRRRQRGGSEEYRNRTTAYKTRA